MYPIGLKSSIMVVGCETLRNRKTYIEILNNVKNFLMTSSHFMADITSFLKISYRYSILHIHADLSNLSTVFSKSDKFRHVL